MIPSGFSPSPPSVAASALSPTNRRPNGTNTATVSPYLVLVPWGCCFCCCWVWVDNQATAILNPQVRPPSPTASNDRCPELGAMG